MIIHYILKVYDSRPSSLWLHGSIELKLIVKDSALLPIIRMDVVSVPLWPASLSGRLRIIGLGAL
jgi:hypothetical protein